MIPSLEMACRSLGAPVRDWRPAPMVESREPTSTTLGWGQAMLPTTKDPPILSPNLEKERVHFLISSGKIGKRGEYNISDGGCPRFLGTSFLEIASERKSERS